MLTAEQKVPLYVPLIFLGFGVVVVIGNRRVFRDRRGWFRGMAEARAKSRVVRRLGGTGDPDTEFEGLWRDRWLFLIITIVYVIGVVWMLVLALTQL